MQQHAEAALRAALRRSTPLTHPSGRRLAFEQLEDRRVLATFTVTNLLDGPVTAAGDLPGSLRQAVFDANHLPGADEIDLTGVSGTLPLTEGEIEVYDSLSISGPGRDLLTVDALQQSRFLNIRFQTDTTPSDFGVSLSDFSIENGAVSDHGGAIYASSVRRLHLSGVRIASSSTTDVHEGGALSVRSGITEILVEDSIIENNFATGPGGGISVRGSRGTLRIVDSTISGNRTAGIFSGGGGVYSSVDLVVQNSLVSGNYTDGFSSNGGGLEGRSITIVNSDVEQNWTGGDESRGGGVRARTITLLNSRVTQNYTLGEYSGGGGLHAEREVEIRDSVISANSTSGPTAGGGGFFASGLGGTESLVEDSLIEGNSVTGDSAFGGGFFIAGHEARVVRTTVRGNQAVGQSAIGGGFASSVWDTNGPGFTLVESSVEGNSTSGGGAEGGGIWSDFDILLLRSTISGNSTTGIWARGGGVSVFRGKLFLNSSTVSGNDAEREGGGISVNALDARYSTITGNHSEWRGGGIYLTNRYLGPGPSILHSIIAGNTASFGANDVYQRSQEAQLFRFNILGDGDRTQFYEEAHTPDANGNLIGNSLGSGLVEPLLGPLADNGGPTKTHALLAGSPAIDMGDPVFDPADPDGDPLTDDAVPSDQRGVAFQRVFAGRIDIGAYESRPNPDFDADGDVDVADLLAQQRGFGAAEAALPDGDADADLDVDADDQTHWASQFGMLYDEPESADFDADADVDLADLLALQRGYGSFEPFTLSVDGDADHDWDVDERDLAVWVTQFGSGPPAHSVLWDKQAVQSPAADGLENALSYGANEDEDDLIDAVFGRWS